MGDGEYLIIPTLAVRKIIYPFSYSLLVTMNYYSGGKKVFYPGENAMTFKTGNQYLIMGKVSFLLNDWISMVNTVFYNINNEDSENGEIVKNSSGWLLSYMPAIYFQIKQLRLMEGIQVSLIGKSAIADPYYFLNVQYIF